jgi:hypothetical protein
MRFAWLGFHVVMLLSVMLAFAGFFDARSTGNFIQDSGNRTNIIIGVIALWIIGAIVFRLIRRFSSY